MTFSQAKFHAPTLEEEHQSAVKAVDFRAAAETTVSIKHSDHVTQRSVCTNWYLGTTQETLKSVSMFCKQVF